MKKIFLIAVALFFMASGLRAQEDEFYKVLPLNHMYVAQGYDTLWLTLDRDYNYCYLFVNGSDIDEDQDGDYTDFKLKVNDAALVDTAFLSDKKLGRDGPIGVAAFDVSAFMHKGDNRIILGSTEDPGQSDYVVIKDLTVACGRDNVYYTLSIESILRGNGYDEYQKQTLDLANGKEGSVVVKLDEGEEYFILAFSPNADADVDVALYSRKGKLIAEDVNRDYKPALLEFSPDKSGKYVIKTKLVENTEGEKARIKLLIYH